MNSDKLDQFIKEQIDSLDRVEVPGTRWDKDASWEKIVGQSRKRKAGVFWLYISGVAAVLLLLITFWFFNFRWDSSNVSTPTISENKISPKAPGLGNNENSGSKTVDELPVEIPEYYQNIENESPLLEEESSPTGRQSKRQFASLPRLNPQSQSAQISTEIRISDKPMLRSFAIGQSSKQPEAFAFNRTYIIRKKTEPKPLEPIPALTLSINMAMKSKVDPPTGSLSRLR